MTTQQLANVAWALGKLKVKDRIKLYERVAAVIQEFHALDLANLVWAYAVLRHYDERISPRLEMVMDEFSVQELVNTTWAIGALQFSNASLLSAVTRSVKEQLKSPTELSLQHLASLAWALAKSSVDIMQDMCKIGQALL